MSFERKADRIKMANLLNEQLNKEDVSKKYFAEKMNIRPEQMCRYLKAEIYPNFDDYEKIMDYFGYPRDNSSYWKFYVLTHAD